MRFTFKWVDFDKAGYYYPFMTWVGLNQSVEVPHRTETDLPPERRNSASGRPLALNSSVSSSLGPAGLPHWMSFVMARDLPSLHDGASQFFKLKKWAVSLENLTEAQPSPNE